MARVATHEIDWRSNTERRLQSVTAALARLKSNGSGPQVLHDARVACRRAEAALRVCRDLLPAKPTRWLGQQIRRCRKSTNTIRDQDVLRRWLQEQKGAVATEVCRTIKRQREGPLARLFKTLGSLHQFDAHVSRAVSKLQNDPPVGWQSYLTHRLLKEVLRFLRSIPRNPSDTGRLHEFRIACKRLKYACEFATEVIPGMGLSSLLKRLKQMQVQLGQIHDTATRIEQLRQIVKSDSSPWLRNSRREQEQLTQEWSSWWRSVPWVNSIGSAVTQIVKLKRMS